MHKRIQFDFTSTESIEVQFDLEFDGTNLLIRNINLHGNYDTGLPTQPEIKYLEKAGEYQFYITYLEMENGKFVDRYEFVINERGRQIIRRIMEIAEEEKPKFIN